MVTGDVSPFRRTVSDFADVPLAAPNAETRSDVTSNRPASVDRVTAREEIRAPPATPKPPPPVRV